MNEEQPEASAPTSRSTNLEFNGLLGKLTSEGLLIGASTALGYLIAVSYEVAYCSFFGVPDFLISPTLPLIATSVSIVTVLLAIAIFVGGQLAARIKTQDSRNKIYIAGGCVTLIGIGMQWVPGMRFLGLGLFVTTLIAVNVVSLTGIVAISGSNGRTRMIVGVLGLAMLVSCVPLMARAIGHHAAAVQKVFYTLSDQRDVLVVRDYGEVLIGVRFDRSKSSLLSETVVIRPQEGSTHRLYREELGNINGFEIGGAWGR